MSKYWYELTEDETGFVHSFVSALRREGNPQIYGAWKCSRSMGDCYCLTGLGFQVADDILAAEEDGYEAGDGWADAGHSNALDGNMWVPHARLWRFRYANIVMSMSFASPEWSARLGLLSLNDQMRYSFDDAATLIETALDEGKLIRMQEARKNRLV